MGASTTNVFLAPQSLNLRGQRRPKGHRLNGTGIGWHILRLLTGEAFFIENDRPEHQTLWVVPANPEKPEVLLSGEVYTELKRILSLT